MPNARLGLITSLGSLVQGEQATRLMYSLFKALDVQQGKLLSSATSPSVLTALTVNLRHSLSPCQDKLRHRLLEVIIGGSSQYNNQMTQFPICGHQVFSSVFEIRYAPCAKTTHSEYPKIQF